MFKAGTVAGLTSAQSLVEIQQIIFGDLLVETKLDLGDRSMRFRVERDPSLCGHLNEDYHTQFQGQN
jgi:hypothetical protein